MANHVSRQSSPTLRAKGQAPGSSHKQHASYWSDTNSSNEEHEVRSAQSHKKAKCAVDADELDFED